MQLMQKILIVDDEEVIRDLLCMTFEDEYETHGCQGGLDAWNWLQENEVDLIITDVVMPGFDGIDLISKIRHTGNKTPIIAISGGSGGRISHLENRLTLAGKSGADALLSKPFELCEITATATALLNKQATNNRLASTPYSFN